jgi:hypothetical protein
MDMARYVVRELCNEKPLIFISALSVIYPSGLVVGGCIAGLFSRIKELKSGSGV